MSNNTQTHQQLVASITGTAKMLGLSRSSIYRLIAVKKLKTVKVGSRRLVPLAAIDALLNQGGQ
jgi:excisionase family DNA binding protein